MEDGGEEQVKVSLREGGREGGTEGRREGGKERTSALSKLWNMRKRRRFS